MRRVGFALAVVLAVVGPRWVSANDTIIAQQIIQKLKHQQQADRLQGFNIGVQANQGTVTLMGQVATSEQGKLAIDIARRVPGVRLVVNDLFLTPESNSTASSTNQNLSDLPIQTPEKPEVKRAVGDQDLQAPTVDSGITTASASIPQSSSPTMASVPEDIPVAPSLRPAPSAPKSPQTVTDKPPMLRRPVPFARSRSKYNGVTLASGSEQGTSYPIWFYRRRRKI